MKWKLAIAALVLAAAIVPGLVVSSELPGLMWPPLDPPPPLQSLSAESCGRCHVAIAAEWRGSQHARSITGALYRADLAREGEPYFCNHCHAPLVEQQPKITLAIGAVFPRLTPIQRSNARYDAALHQEGITCVVCHLVDGALEGPRGSPAPHPTRKSTALADGSICARCHTLAMTTIGDLQRPLMDTPGEWREYRARGGTQRCVDCHMPEREGRRSHALLGPSDEALVSKAVELRRFDVRFGDDAMIAELELFNAAGHRLPTGDPHRAVIVRLVALDGEDTPLAEGRAMIERRVDLERLSEVPGNDTALAPRELRRIELRVPTRAKAQRARLIVELRRWDPSHPVAIAAGLDAAALTRTMLVEKRRIAE